MMEPFDIFEVVRHKLFYVMIIFVLRDVKCAETEPGASTLRYIRVPCIDKSKKVPNDITSQQCCLPCSGNRMVYCPGNVAILNCRYSQ